MKLVLVNRFFHPDFAPTGRLAARVAFDAAAAGREVHVITSRQRYEDPDPALPARDEVRGVRIHRVWTTRFGRALAAGRVLDYLSFHISSTLALVGLLRAGDVAVAMTDPPLLSACVACATRVRGARLVNWLQDIFPETAERAGAGVLGALLRRLRDWSVRRAVDNVVVGERMAGELERLVPGAARTLVCNWADGRAIRPMPAEQSAQRARWGLDGRFVVGYSGNLGRVHDCDTLLAAARLLAPEPGIAFSFTGGGAHFARLRAAGLPNVSVRDYLPESALADGLAACDVHLVTLLPAFEGLVVPSKLFSIAAAGRAAIFVGDPRGEVARLLEAHGCGVSVAPGDGEGLAAAIRALRDEPARLRAMGARARAAFEREWDEPIALARWRAVIAKAAG